MTTKVEKCFSLNAGSQSGFFQRRQEWMYKVYYYVGGGNNVGVREFSTLQEATNFANKQPIQSVLEIKKYECETDYTKD